MLIPNKTKKDRRYNKGRVKGVVVGSECKVGTYYIKSLENAKMSNKQIEAVRITIKKECSNTRVIFRVYPHHTKTKKPQETRMGGGKAAIVGFEAIVKVGQIVVEITDAVIKEIIKVYRILRSKFSFKTKLMYRYAAVEV